jgi:S-adenosylmethionine decarboxylase
VSTDSSAVKLMQRRLPPTSHQQSRSEDTSAFPARGKHLLVTLSGCSFDLLNNQEEMVALTRLAATSTGATVIDVLAHRFDPQGVTALALLAESHASLHTYPEAGVVFWDCFTCGDTCDPLRSIDELKYALNPISVQTELILRR